MSEPRLFGITVCHMDPTIIASSIARFHMTAGRGIPGPHWIWIDNCWPVDPETSRQTLQGLTRINFNPTLRIPKNVGGHGGATLCFNYLHEQFKFEPHDLVLGYDPDSWPVEKSWLPAMVEVMKARPELTHLSLFVEHRRFARAWKISDVDTPLGRIRIAQDSSAEMYNVTIWRAGFLLARGGFKATTAFYGGVEACMFKAGEHAYLYDYSEIPHPIEHPKVYKDWKVAHAAGQYPGNFDQYVREHP